MFMFLINFLANPILLVIASGLASSPSYGKITKILNLNKILLKIRFYNSPYIYEVVASYTIDGKHIVQELRAPIT